MKTLILVSMTPFIHFALRLLFDIAKRTLWHCGQLFRKV